jgi:hypothetical protein
MSTVLLQEDALQVRPEGDVSTTIPVAITVNVSNGKTLFVADKTDDYVITEEAISLIGSGGTPREFRLTFALSSQARDDGWLFENPALKFFQGGSKKVGFRVPPDEKRTSATLSVFNLLAIDDPCVEDSFNVLVVSSKARIAHDPTILWEPPKG